MSNLPDVQAVLPFGDTKKVKILASKAKGITKESVVKALADTDYKVTAFTAKQLKKKAKKGD